MYRRLSLIVISLFLASLLVVSGAAAQTATPDNPDQSELLKNSKDAEFILRNFKTMYVDALYAKYFDSEQMKAALGRNKGFAALHIRMVDDPRVARDRGTAEAEVALVGDRRPAAPGDPQRGHVREPAHRRRLLQESSSGDAQVSGAGSIRLQLLESRGHGARREERFLHYAVRSLQLPGRKLHAPHRSTRRTGA